MRTQKCTTTAPRAGLASLGLALGMLLTSCSGGIGSVTVEIPDDANSSVALDTGSGTLMANGVENATLTVTLRLADGVVAASMPIAVTSSRGSLDTISPSTGATDSNGVFSTSIATTSAGAGTLRIILDPDGVAVALSTEPAFTFAAGPASASTSQITVTGTPQPLADGTDSVTMTITVTDAFGNPLAGETVQIASTGTGNSITQPATVTDSAGDTQATITSTVGGTKSISATVDPSGDAIVLDSTLDLSFVGPPRLSGAARFLDINRNGIADAGDTILVPFDETLASTAGVSTTDFVNQVTSDSFGTGGSAALSSFLIANSATITLGSSPVLNARGDFDVSQITAGSPSGIGLANSIAAGALVGISTGLDVDTTSPPIDLSPGFVTTGQSLGGTAQSTSAELVDVNRDGNLDLVVGNLGTADVIYLNDGSGRLTDSQWLGSTNDTAAILLLDADTDGDQDLVTASTTTSSKLWLNNGNGVFSDSAQSLGPTEPSSVAAGDIDRDGDLDLVFGALGAADVVWINNGTGTFTDSLQSLGGSVDTRDVVLTDVDRDGDLDLVSATDSGVANRILTNDGTGTFSDSGRTVGTADATALVAGDVDQDGDEDLVVGTDGAADEVYINDGDGNFAELAQELHISMTNDLELQDFDGDGDLDLAIAERTPLSPGRVAINDGTGVFTVTSETFGLLLPSTVAKLGDIDGDGDADLMFARSGAGNEVWAGSLSGARGTASLVAGSTLGPGTLVDIASADVDGDGDLDVFTADATVASRLYRNDGSGTLSQDSQSFASFERVTFGDIDGDHDLDLIAVATSGTHVDVLTNDGTGTFSDTAQSLGTSVSHAKLGDFDGDGDLDIALLDSNQPVIWTNNGSGTFPTSDPALSFTGFSGITVNDFDRDGDLDLALPSAIGGNAIAANDGSGNFSIAQAFGPGSSVLIVSIDVDRDGDLDLYDVISDGANKIWLNNGSGSFSDSGQSIGSASSASGDVFDFDGDGYLDLLDAHSSVSSTLVFLNDRDGTFSASTASTVGAGQIHAVDLDGDGDSDVLIDISTGLFQVFNR